MKRLFEAAALSLLMVAGAACSDRAASDRPKPAASTAARPAPAIALAGRVTDAANLLDPALEARLTEKLDALEQATGHQLVVVTAPSLGGRDVKPFTTDLFNAWGIGRAEQDDGVVLLVAPNERRARIEVGYGLEGRLTNAVSARIMQDEIIPHFRRGDLPGGIEAGVDALASRLQEPWSPSAGL
jgi:uncharacterized protein